MNILPTMLKSCGFESNVESSNPIKNCYPGMHARDQKAHVLGLAIVSALGAFLSGALLPFEFSVVLVPAFTVIAITALIRYCLSGKYSPEYNSYPRSNVVVHHTTNNPVVIPVHTQTTTPSSWWSWSSWSHEPSYTRHVPSTPWHAPTQRSIVTAPTTRTTAAPAATTIRTPAPAPAPSSTYRATGFTRDTYDRTTGSNIPATSAPAYRAPAETYRPSTSSSSYSSSSHSAPERSSTVSSYTPSSSFEGRAPAQTYTASATATTHRR